ncbi:hypothetical protein AUJ10_01205 [Candidatus Pacearchaeota archaeon CG1_02_31_27]|nr:MAG: hypothetical protein AUJ10_01205 [Candidatus Pacearchaeota archaeon CG1_02_31_27]
MKHTHISLHYLLNRELSEMYVMLTLRSFALSLVGIFIPIYLYQNGLTLRFIFLFFALMYGVFSVVCLIIPKIIAKIGYKHSMAISFVFLIISLVLLSYLKSDGSYLISGTILGISMAFFWPAFHLDFVKYSIKKKRAKQISGYMAVSTLATMLGPLIGGIVLSVTNFNILFIITILLLAISLIPLFYSKEENINTDFSYKNFIRNLTLRRYFSNNSWLVTGTVMGIIWPLFIFLIVKGYFSVGILETIMLLLSFLSTIFFGWLTDKMNKIKLFKVLSAINSIISFSRILVTTFIQAITVNFFYGLVNPGITISQDCEIYNECKKNPLEDITIREFSAGSGRVLFFLVLVILPYFALAFALCGLISLGALFAKSKI